VKSNSSPWGAMSISKNVNALPCGLLRLTPTKGLRSRPRSLLGTSAKIGSRKKRGGRIRTRRAQFHYHPGREDSEIDCQEKASRRPSGFRQGIGLALNRGQNRIAASWMTRLAVETKGVDDVEHRSRDSVKSGLPRVTGPRAEGH